MKKEKSKLFFEDSREGTIGARIRVLLEETGKSISKLEEDGGLGNGTLKTWRDVKAENFEDSTNSVKIFLNKSGINPDWWETGEGKVFIAASEGNHTGVENNGKNLEIPLGVNLDEESKRLLRIANNTVEYAFIPKTILEGEYRIELKSQLDERKIALTETLDAYKKLVKKLEEEVADLRSGKIPIHVAATQNTK